MKEPFTQVALVAALAIAGCIPEPCPQSSVCKLTVDSGVDAGRDAGPQPSGFARLDGGRVFPTHTATFMVRQYADGGIDYGQGSIHLEERVFRCSGPNVHEPLAQDAGSERGLQISWDLRPASSLPVGSHSRTADGGVPVAVSLNPPGGTGSFVNAERSEVLVTASSANEISGTFSASFPGDAEPTTGVFRAEFCGVFYSVGP